MEFEQLQYRTVELLASKACEFGLPPHHDDNATEEESIKNYTNDTVFANALSAALKEAYDKELTISEKQDAPEVMALRSNMKRLRVLKERIDAYTTTMKELRSAYDGVTARTSSLHDACDRALAQQTALAAGSEQIKTNLYFFKQADIIMKKLNNTSKLSVTGQTFTAMLATIDECITFLKQHPEYKESAVYIGKYEQCLSRAMTSIRMGVLSDIEVSVTDVREKQAQLQVDYEKLGKGRADDDTFALLYGVFASKASSVKTALSVAEQRFSAVPEFQAMLAECQQAYFQTRVQLLGPIIQATLNHLANIRGESSCGLARSGCLFILRVCDDEYRLYKQFFNTEGVEESEIERMKAPSVYSANASLTVHPFEEFVEGISRILYDMLRPLVVHNPHLETLAEICAILKVEMIEERCSLLTSVVEDGSFDPRAGFIQVMNELVGDVAERIVYRAESYGISDIVNYKPAAGDLAYPEKLEMMKTIEKDNLKNKANESIETIPEQEAGTATNDTDVLSSSAPISAVDLHCLWYPTVRRTVMCLAKLFKCLDMGVFQSLARELLIMCCDSLQSAAEQICSSTVKKSGRSKRIDAELFVVKHLLILREQTTPYRQAASHRADATLPTREVTFDFTKMKNSIFDDPSRLFQLSSNNAFLELLFSVPVHLSEQSNDSRLVIDSRLRSSCNQLVQTSTQFVLGDLTTLVDRAEDESLQPGFDLKTRSHLSPEKFGEAVNLGFKALSNKWPEIRMLYNLYIGVMETEGILLSPVRKRISEVFSRAIAFSNKCYDEESKSIAGLPNIQQVHLLLNKN
ncbi:unnamed protein product [Auanema sp. JU1783]|nr:unnamed protein product [Auanema sp. JU1783]